MAVDHSLIGFFERLDPPHDGRHASAYLPRYAVPVGLAVSSVHALLQPLDTVARTWILRSVRLTWKRAATPQESLEASAQLLHLSERDCECAVECRAQGGDLLYEGVMRAVATQGGSYLPLAGLSVTSADGTESQTTVNSSMQALSTELAQAPSTNDLAAEPEQPPLALLRDAILEHGCNYTRLTAYSDWVRLLCSPVAGTAEPLGRRIHPLGGYAICAALVAAQALQRHRSRGGDAEPPRALVSLDFAVRAAWNLDDILVADATEGDGGEVWVKVSRQQGGIVATSKIRFQT